MNTKGKYNSKMYMDFTNVCNSYVQTFCEKHGLDYSDVSWVGDNVGTIIIVGDYFISFNDILVDIEENIPEDKYFEYYEWSLVDGHNWNYTTWLKGGYPTIQPDVIEQNIKEFKEYISEINII